MGKTFVCEVYSLHLHYTMNTQPILCTVPVHIKTMTASP